MLKGKRAVGIFLVTVLAFGLIYIIARHKQQRQADAPPIKLVVGIVVDQMRADYLYRFASNYSERGFKRLLNEGANFRNLRYNYVPTKTGPGHASIYTGATPSIHGIVSNEWYVAARKEGLNCVEDPSVQGLGGAHHGKPSYSPKNLLATTVADELKLANPSSKTIGISFKNRGAILPVGHTADYAFWYDKKSGQFVTSTYYTDTLPQWLKSFNRRGYVTRSLGKKWSTKLPIDKYTNSGPDDAPFEMIYPEKKRSVFPYEITDPERFSETPYANILLTELAQEVIEKERLGQDHHTDFLTISYSATDAIGHLFGIRSKEIEDTYVWLDLQLAVFLEYLDRSVGKDNYLLFLTADHGAVDHPNFLRSKKIPGGNLFRKELQLHIDQNFSKQLEKHGTLVEKITSGQLYLSKKFKEVLYQNEALRQRFLRTVNDFQGIRKVYFAQELDRLCTREVGFVRNGHHFNRSGDVYFLYEPGWIPHREYGTTHGTHYVSDTHIPLLWYGSSIPKREIFKRHEITDIAPTLSALLHIPLPASSSGEILEEIFVEN